MTIKELIQKYNETVTETASNMQSRVVKILNDLSDALYRGDFKRGKKDQWQIELEEVDDYLTAMLAFNDMSLRKIDQKTAALLTYYYASKILNDNYPEDMKKTAYCVRATIVFQNNSLFQEYCCSIDDYNGILQDKGHFFNILLLADYYSAEGNSLNYGMYSKMAPVANRVASFHSEFSKPQIILLGLDASNHLYKHLSRLLENPAFPIMNL